jgi:hypothetical protein
MADPVKVTRRRSFTMKQRFAHWPTANFAGARATDKPFEDEAKPKTQEKAAADSLTMDQQLNPTTFARSYVEPELAAGAADTPDMRAYLRQVLFARAQRGGVDPNQQDPVQAALHDRHKTWMESYKSAPPEVQAAYKPPVLPYTVSTVERADGMPQGGYNLEQLLADHGTSLRGEPGAGMPSVMSKMLGAAAFAPAAKLLPAKWLGARGRGAVNLGSMTGLSALGAGAEQLNQRKHRAFGAEGQVQSQGLGGSAPAQATLQATDDINRITADYASAVQRGDWDQASKFIEQMNSFKPETVAQVAARNVATRGDAAAAGAIDVAFNGLSAKIPAMSVLNAGMQTLVGGTEGLTAALPDVAQAYAGSGILRAAPGVSKLPAAATGMSGIRGARDLHSWATDPAFQAKLDRQVGTTSLANESSSNGGKVLDAGGAAVSAVLGADLDPARRQFGASWGRVLPGTPAGRAVRESTTEARASDAFTNTIAQARNALKSNPDYAYLDETVINQLALSAAANQSSAATLDAANGLDAGSENSAQTQWLSRYGQAFNRMNQGALQTADKQLLEELSGQPLTETNGRASMSPEQQSAAGRNAIIYHYWNRGGGRQMINQAKATAPATAPVRPATAPPTAATPAPAVKPVQVATPSPAVKPIGAPAVPKTAADNRPVYTGQVAVPKPPVQMVPKPSPAPAQPAPVAAPPPAPVPPAPVPPAPVPPAPVAAPVPPAPVAAPAAHPADAWVTTLLDNNASAAFKASFPAWYKAQPADVQGYVMDQLGDKATGLKAGLGRVFGLTTREATAAGVRDKFIEGGKKVTDQIAEAAIASTKDSKGNTDWLGYLTKNPSLLLIPIGIMAAIGGGKAGKILGLLAAAGGAYNLYGRYQALTSPDFHKYLQAKAAGVASTDLDAKYASALQDMGYLHQSGAVNLKQMLGDRWTQEVTGTFTPPVKAAQ